MWRHVEKIQMLDPCAALAINFYDKFSSGRVFFLRKESFSSAWIRPYRSWFTRGGHSRLVWLKARPQVVGGAWCHGQRWEVGEIVISSMERAYFWTISWESRSDKVIEERERQREKKSFSEIPAQTRRWKCWKKNFTRWCVQTACTASSSTEGWW